MARLSSPEWQPPADPRELARREQAEQLRDEALAHIDPALVEAARQALQVSQAAAAIVYRLQAEKRDLASDVSAQAALVQLMAAGNPAAVRPAAASKVIDIAIKSVELEDLAARLEALEKAYAAKL